MQLKWLFQSVLFCMFVLRDVSDWFIMSDEQNIYSKIMLIECIGSLIVFLTEYKDVQ